MVTRRGVHSDHRVDFELSVSGRFEISFMSILFFHIIVNHFLSRLKLDLVTKSGKFRFIGSMDTSSYTCLCV